jgi:hypothetical protein
LSRKNDRVRTSAKQAQSLEFKLQYLMRERGGRGEEGKKEGRKKRDFCETRVSNSGESTSETKGNFHYI